MKITEHRLPTEIITDKLETPGSTEDFSLILDKAVAKTQEDTLDYEKELLKRGQELQAEQESFSVLPFIPQQIIDMQTQAITPPAELKTANIAKPATSIQNNIDSVKQDNSALQPVAQQVVQQLAKVLNKADGLNVQSGMELRSLLPKQRALPVIPFDQLYTELVKHTKTMREGSTLRLKLVLEPDKLGVIDVYMVLDGKQQLAVMFAAQDDTRKLLENSGQDLAHVLAQNGYSLNNMQFMDFSGSGHQELEKEFTVSDDQNSHNDAEILNIWGQTDIINSVNTHLASVVVNYVT